MPQASNANLFLSPKKDKNSFTVKKQELSMVLNSENSASLATSKWNIGVDIVDVARFRQLGHLGSAHFLERTFTPQEIKHCMSFRDPAPHFAANFAAKEAVYKAISSFHDIKVKNVEVLRNGNGEPRVNLHFDAEEKDENAHGKGDRTLEVKVSLSHSASYAIAFAVAADSKETPTIIRLPTEIGVYL